MSVSGNFERVALAGKALTVSGTSEPLDDGELISRHVAVQQGERVAHEAVALDLEWTVDLPAAGFRDTEPVLAVGVETYFTENEIAKTGDQLPSFVTFTWSQTLELE